MRTNRYLFAIAALGLATGCGYLGSARPIESSAFDVEPGWVAVRNIPFLAQEGETDCGAACAAMVLTHGGQPSTTKEVVAAGPSSKEGMRAGDLRDFIKGRGLKSFLIHGTLDDLKTELAAGRPVIVGLKKPYTNAAWDHYEVVMAIHPEKKCVATLDPARGLRQNTYEGFLREWEPTGKLTIVVVGKDGASGSTPKPPSTEWGAGGRKLEANPLLQALSPLMGAPDTDSRSGTRRPPSPRNMRQLRDHLVVQESDRSREGSRA